MTTRFARFFVLAVIAAALSNSVFAQSDQGLESRMFGLGQPATLQELPPGQLKHKIKSLPPKAQGRAMQWLQSFAFPTADVTTLDVDREGNIFYVDSTVIEAGGEEALGAEAVVEAAPQSTLDDVFLLHSKPNAANTVFVDFDGHTFSNTAWGAGTFSARAYSTDSDYTTFSNAERTKMVDIWHRIAEDLAPFDIDVTTEEPGTFDRYTGHILITHSQQTNGADMPHPTAGGVAYVGVFGASNYHTYYSPALVYFNNLGNGFEHYVAEASSHEFGHNLGLSHDGTSAVGYYSGHGSGLVSWAPIMGVGYYQNVTQWSKGEYDDANNLQDDLAIIDSKLAYDADDHGDTLQSASALDVAVDGTVVSSNPELDPHNLLPQNKGVVGHAGDMDVFSFLAGAGTINLTVTPAWDAFTRSDRRGANLDVLAELRDANNLLITSSDPLTDTMATVTASVSGGAYYLLVQGVGNATSPYSDYASMGEYFINGSVPASAGDKQAPTPDPMGFASAPAAISENAISMTAMTATDNLSAVQYEFRCTTGGSGCVNSGWQSSTSSPASGLAPATQYTFTVVAKDQSGNPTAPSDPASATTDAPPTTVDYLADSDLPVAGSVSGTVNATHSDDGSTETITERDSGGKPQSRYAYLEHRWNFNIGSGPVATVYAQAWMSGPNSNEIFDLEYSTDGGNSFSRLMSINSVSSANLQMANLPVTSGGAVILRVKDTHRQPGYRTANSFNVDHLFIRVDNSGEPPPAIPPATPVGMTALAASSSAINLTWTDMSNDEDGFKVERSPNGVDQWVEIATLGAGTESHGDVGLDAATHYFYRVSSWNTNGSEGYATADETTLAGGGQDPQISITTAGYKDKGRQGVIVEWTGAATVDVYRDGTMVGPNKSGGSYDDFIGQKGGATYEHQVCETGGVTNCSLVTTTIF